MNQQQELVAQWMRKVGQEVKTKPEFPRNDIRVLRTKLIFEEFGEYELGELNDDLPNIAKEMADMLVILYGTANAYGFDLGAVFNEVMASNNSKIGAKKRADGKVTKGDNYKPADVEGVWLL
jgi:NTP pyrophosphatase (non-canonical NTP hydrolase)